MRAQIAHALGSASDPALVQRALALTLDEGLDVRDVDKVLWAPIAILGTDIWVMVGRRRAYRRLLSDQVEVRQDRHPRKATVRA